MRMRPTVLTALAGALLLALAAPAAGAPEPTYGGPLSDLVKMKVGKQAGGPYKNATRVSMELDEVKNVYLKAKTLSGKQGAELFIGRQPSAVGMRWFKQSGVEITDQVEGGGYEFTLRAGNPKQFRLRMKLLGPDLDVCFKQPLLDDDGDSSEPLIAINVNPELCA